MSAPAPPSPAVRARPPAPIPRRPHASSGNAAAETDTTDIDQIIERQLDALRPHHERYLRLLELQQLLNAPAPPRPSRPPRARPGAAREAILRVLAAGPANATHLQKATGIHPRNLTYNLRRLILLGTIHASKDATGTLYTLAAREHRSPRSGLDA
jgi:DNA-binding transcriptional ArsR family regulator